MKEHIVILLSSIAIVAAPCLVQARELSPQIEALMDAVIQAHEAEATNTTNGAGSANVRVVHKSGGQTPEDTNELVHFWFQGHSTRSDFSTSDVAATPVSHSSVDNGEFYYGYRKSSNNAWIERSGRSGFTRTLGKDFHPDVFYNWIGILKVSETFKRMKSNPILKLEVQFTQTGFLKFIATSDQTLMLGNEEVRQTTETYFLLDPKHSYRILACHNKQDNVNGVGSAEISRMQIDWKDYDSGEAYPIAIKSYAKTILSPKLLSNPPQGVKKLDRELETLTHITIAGFRSDVNIPATVFTLEGIGVKQGTRIDDTLSGITYTYGTDIITEDSLESLLNHSNVTPFSSDPSIHSAQDAASPNELNPDILSKEDATKVVLTTTKNPIRLVILICAVLIALAVAATLSRFVMRRK